MGAPNDQYFIFSLKCRPEVCFSNIHRQNVYVYISWELSHGKSGELSRESIGEFSGKLGFEFSGALGREINGELNGELIS